MSTNAFPISYWHGVPANMASLERYQEVAEAGFSIALFGGTEEQIKKALDWCRQAGVVGMVIDSRMPNPRVALPEDLDARLEGITSAYSKHPALWGYFITDEPSAEEFERLRTITDKLRQLDPAHPSYINLYPNYANEQQLGTKTYDEHLSRYVDEVKPPLVSYDHYCFRIEGMLRGGYFENLEAVRRNSLSAGLDFWQIVLSTPLFDWPDIGEAEFRWQVWTSLAYGAKGISYYTYWGIDDGAPHWNAIIDVYGYRTNHYPIVRRVNLGVAKIGSHLLGLQSVGVRHGKGTEGADIGDRRYLLEGAPDRTIVGEFVREDGGAAIIAVNDDLVNGIRVTARIAAKYKSYRPVSRISGIPGGARKTGGESGEGVIDILLPPGDGTLIYLDTE